MDVRVSDVKKWAGREEVQELDDAWPSLAQERVDFPLLDSAHIEVKVRNTGGALIVEFSGVANVEAQCSRCLEEFVLPISFRMTEEFREEPGGDDPTLDYYRFVGDKIELDRFIADAVGVNVPLAPICREDCMGLCAQCGANLNVSACTCRPTLDERWAVLERLAHEPD